MFQLVRRVDGTVLWANLHLLFWLSLFPFTTAWMDETDLARTPLVVYGVNLLAAAIAYYVLQLAIFRAEGPDGLLRRRGRAATSRASSRRSSTSPASPRRASPAGWPSRSTPWSPLIWLVPDRRMEAYVAAHGLERLSVQTAEHPGDAGRDLAQRPAAVGDRVLLLGAELGGGEPVGGVLVGDEQHVVPEAAAPPLLADHAAGHPALRRPRSPPGVAERDRAGEVRAAPLVGDVARAGRAAARCCASSAPSGRVARPARGQHARHPVERVDAQARCRRRATAARWPRGRRGP